MGLFNFIKNAGPNVVGTDDESKSKKLTEDIINTGVDIVDFNVVIEDSVATVSGEAGKQAIKEKVILMVGNIKGIETVNDEMSVRAQVVEVEAAEPVELAEPEPVSQFYTVESGDSLGAIAKKFYGEAGKYTVIFEANKPMLKNPDLIYPGQTLRIPPIEE